MKVALVHDDLVQWGGAERVLAALSEIFPDAPIYTLVYDESNQLLARNFQNKKIITSFIQKIPGWKSVFKALLPLHPIAFEQFDFSEFDLVISQTTRFAKAIITQPQTKHICYCHTPPRFLWHFSGEGRKGSIEPLLSWLRYYDKVSSHRVDQWVAGSDNAKRKIGQIYRQPSEIIYPFVDLERFEGMTTFNGGYLLVISRLNKYKRVDLVVSAANRLKVPLKVVGSGPELANLQNMAGPTVDLLGSVDEEILVLLLAGCQALVVAAEEDFGLTPLEAQALGKPVVAYNKGGVLESVIEEETGFFFREQTVENLIAALQSLDKKGYNEEKCKQQAQRFSKERFNAQFKRLINSL